MAQVMKPAFFADRITVSQHFKEFLIIISDKKGRQRTIHFHAASFAAVADRAVRRDLDMFECSGISMFTDIDLPVVDHGSAKMNADIKIDKIGKLRGSPEFGAGCRRGIMEKTAGEWKILLEPAEPEPGTVKDPSVRYYGSVCTDQPGEGDSDPEDLLLPERKRSYIFIDVITDSMYIFFRVGVCNREDFSLIIFPGKVDHQNLELLFQYFYPDGDTVIRNDDIGGGFPSYLVRGDLTSFFYHSHLFEIIEFGCYGRPAKAKIKGDILQRDRTVLINIVINQLKICPADLAGSYCSFHFITAFFVACL
jgi:hypothetical protein